MKKIDVMEYANHIFKAIPNGVLATTKAEGKVNTMTIGWATFGIEWGKPIFAVYIREGRFTREQLDKNPEFTINVPYGEYDKKIIGICGSKTGRSCDKIKEAGLTLIDGIEVNVPAIKELPLTLECKVIFREKQEIKFINNKFEKFYPQDVDSNNVGANKDAHIAYYGEIVNAYILD